MVHDIVQLNSSGVEIIENSEIVIMKSPGVVTIKGSGHGTIMFVRKWYNH